MEKKYTIEQYNRQLVKWVRVHCILRHLRTFTGDAAQLPGKCKWTRTFDGHFNISCPSGERANGNFKPDKEYNNTTWDFKYCPYCGREIEI